MVGEPCESAPAVLLPVVSGPFVANGAFGGINREGVGEQMRQIREEICSWVALGKLEGLGRTVKRGWLGKEMKMSLSFFILQGLLNTHFSACMPSIKCNYIINKG